MLSKLPIGDASIQASAMNDNDLPILPQVMSFNCLTTWSFSGELLDGYIWKQMLELHVPYLFKFEFHMWIAKKRPKLDLDIVVSSFEYFVRKYSNWHMIINRWRFNGQTRGK
ncbi:unnamed protein product [Rotaria sp. Silwood2]|nr:unnamed protein product [Rotaria sp. Silwood2]CAF4408715.1 unnamed protein product [Rotaria sp. Silwood2]